MTPQIRKIEGHWCLWLRQYRFDPLARDQLHPLVSDSACETVRRCESEQQAREILARLYRDGLVAK